MVRYIRHTLGLIVMTTLGIVSGCTLFKENEELPAQTEPPRRSSSQASSSGEHHPGGKASSSSTSREVRSAERGGDQPGGAVDHPPSADRKVQTSSDGEEARSNDPTRDEIDDSTERENEREKSDDGSNRSGRAKVSPGFVFIGHPHTEEMARITLFGDETTEIPVRGRPRPNAEIVGTFELRRDERFEIGESRVVIEGDTKPSPVAFSIRSNARCIEGPGHNLPVEVERGERISVARQYRGEGLSDAYIWYDGSVYIVRLRDLKLSNPEIMDSDAGFANRGGFAVPARDDTAMEALGLLGHQSFSPSSDSSSWWGQVQTNDAEGWIRCDRDEIRVVRCFSSRSKEGDDCAEVSEQVE